MEETAPCHLTASFPFCSLYLSERALPLSMVAPHLHSGGRSRKTRSTKPALLQSELSASLGYIIPCLRNKRTSPFFQGHYQLPIILRYQRTYPGLDCLKKKSLLLKIKRKLLCPSAVRERLTLWFLEGVCPILWGTWA